jgi:hypothetical protein
MRSKSDKIKSGETLSPERKQELEANGIPVPDLDIDDIAKNINVLNEEERPKLEEEQTETRKEQAEEFNKMLETEDEFLELFNEERFDLKVVFKGRIVEFKVKPITPNMDAKLLEPDKTVFNDISAEERAILQKHMSGEPLNEDEAKVVAKLTDMSESKNSRALLKRTNEILAQHISIPIAKTSYEKKTYRQKLKWWSEEGGADFFLKFFLVNEVVQRLGADQRSMDTIFLSQNHPSE